MCSGDRHEWQWRRRLRLLLLKVVNLFRRESVSHSFRIRSFGAISFSRVKVRGDPFSPPWCAPRALDEDKTTPCYLPPRVMLLAMEGSHPFQVGGGKNKKAESYDYTHPQ
ncbi:hypothetical protein MTO96_001362 [Rhipicephalus appendiculatus]